jgi:rSAM/selenodomain-associated transferase 2
MDPYEAPGDHRPSGSRGRFDVLIPTRNEAESLPGTVAALRAAAAADGFHPEVVVIDHASTDGTGAVAAGLGVRVLQAAGGRGAQLRAGAAGTSGEVLLVVHADTWLPPGAFAAIQEALRDPAVVAGGFRKAFRDGPWLVRWQAARRSAVITRCTGFVFGDQAAFVRRTALDQVAGFPDQPLLEDVELMQRVRRVGRVVLLRPVVQTSGRRFAGRGAWSTWWLMLRILWAYRRGVAPAELVRWYG